MNNDISEVSGQQVDINHPLERYRSVIRGMNSLDTRLSVQNRQNELQKSVVTKSRSDAPSLLDTIDAKHDSMASRLNRFQNWMSKDSLLPSKKSHNSSGVKLENKEETLKRHPWITVAKRSI